SVNLDPPLQRAWQKLASSLDQSNATALDFARITNQSAETRQAVILVDNAKKKTAARLELDAALRARMDAPFQLVDYQTELSKQMDDLLKLAKTNQVTIEPAVLTGFPEHTADVRQPA